MRKVTLSTSHLSVSPSRSQGWHNSSCCESTWDERPSWSPTHMTNKKPSVPLYLERRHVWYSIDIFLAGKDSKVVRHHSEITDLNTSNTIIRMEKRDGPFFVGGLVRCICVTCSHPSSLLVLSEAARDLDSILPKISADYVSSPQLKRRTTYRFP